MQELKEYHLRSLPLNRPRNSHLGGTSKANTFKGETELKSGWGDQLKGWCWRGSFRELSVGHSRAQGETLADVGREKN